MQLSRARFLSSERTMYQGACLVSVASSIASRAREYSYHCSREGRSIGLSFHCRSGSSIRAWNRLSCSSSLTSSQNLISGDAAVDDVASRTPGSVRGTARTAPSCRSPSRARRRPGCTSSGRRSRPRRRPGSAPCSAACTSGIFSRSEGAGSATSGTTRGLTRSVMALIVPPLPARVAALEDDDDAQPFVPSPSPAAGRTRPAACAARLRIPCA